ncbi:MAG: DUF255 domain-containing protein [Bacteroidales bacterium]|nr:DUF255 domain-containing protein [Bacteroidales bacterium]
MKLKLLLFIALGCLMGGSIHAQQIEWKTIEQASKTDTKSNTKLYFVDFYTSWCGWCKKMDRETFKDPTVIAIMNKYYIAVKFDAEGNAEFAWNGSRYNNVASAPGNRPNTHSFAKKVLGAKMGFPSFGLFKSDQTQLTVIQGYQHPKDLVMMLWYFASGDNKRYTFDKYQQIFDKEIRPIMEEKLAKE